jgi:hypothetical protein
MNRPEICTCSHPRDAHRERAPTENHPGPQPAACLVAHCTCVRYDRRTFSDAELAQIELEHLEAQRAALQAARTETAPPGRLINQRLADALERIAPALEVIAADITRRNPCPAGGHHIWVYQSDELSKCQNCPATRRKDPSKTIYDKAPKP